MQRYERQQPARSLPDDGEYLEERHNHRAIVVRRALLFIPAGIVLTAILVYALLNLPGTIVMAIVIGIAAIAVDIEAISAFRDLFAQPVTTRDEVQRSWHKSRFLFFGRVHYLIVNRRLFEVDPVIGLEIRRGDEVEVQHWPHTNVIVTLTRIKQAEDDKDVR